MACTARVLVVGDESSAALGLAEKLEKRGFLSLCASSAAEAVDIAGGEAPDIVVINAHGGGVNALDLGKTLKSAPPTRHIPVILIGDRAPAPESSTASAGVDEFLPSACTDAELFARLTSLVRLSTMKAELNRRSDTAQQYGVKATVAVEPPTDVKGAQVLVIGSGRDELYSIGRVFDGKFRFSVAETPFEALNDLNQESFDAVVFAANGSAGEVLEFCSDVRNNARLHNIPVLVIAERDSFEDPEAPFQKGASDVLYRPLDTAELEARTRTLVSQQRYRRAMQETYREALHIATSDSLTGLYNHGFLHQHLAGQIEDAERWSKHLTVGFFDVAGMAAINKAHGYAAGDRLLRQIGGMIGWLVRGEDLAARYGGEEFCVVLPETALDVAAVALGRIAGVIGHTEFALSDDADPVMVKLKVGSAVAGPGDTAESLIAKARDNMD